MTGSLESILRRGAVALGAMLGIATLLSLSFAAGAAAKGEFEPNDTRETAYGPLEGGKWYTAEFETENDVDWYVFYVKTYSQMDFSATAAPGGPDCRPYLYLYDRDGKQINSFRGGFLNETRHLLVTLDPGRYYLSSQSCTEARYRFRIDPATAITTSPECGESIVARDAALPQLADVEGKMKQNGGVLHKARLEVRRTQRRLNRARKALRRTRARARTRYRVRSARYRVRAAKRERGRAGETKRRVAAERAQLGAVRRQHQGVIDQANVTIATHC